MARLHAGGGLPQRVAHGAPGAAGERGQREGPQLAEGRLPQADDRGLQGDEGCRRRVQESSETLGPQTERGEEIHTPS